MGLAAAPEFRYVVFPQALRTGIPPIVGFAVILYQGTSLAFAIALPELLSRAYNIATISFQFTSALILAGLVYAGVSMFVTMLVSATEGRLLGLAVVLIAALLAGACKGDESQAAAASDVRCVPRHQFKTIRPGRLTVIAYVSPPYSTEDERGRLGGVDGDIIARIASMECLEIHGTGVSASAFIPLVQTGRADIAIGGIYATPERAKAVDLTDTVWVDGMSFVSTTPMTRISELPGRKVGVVQGYLWSEDLGEVLGAGSLRLYQTVPALVSDIESGRIDVGVLGTAEAALRVGQRAEAGLGMYPVEPDPRVAASTAPGRIVFPHMKGNVALTRALNDDVAALRADGTLRRILTRHGLPESANNIG